MMGQFVAESQKTILQRMVNKVVARSELKDLTDTSQVLQVLAATARAVAKTQRDMVKLLKDRDMSQATGTDLEEAAAVVLPRAIYKGTGTKATGQVVFSRSGTTGTITIAVGKRVKVIGSSSGETLIYESTSLGTILDGFSDSNNVDIIAEDVGTKYNVAPDTITGFVDKPSGVDTVTNPAALTNGTDAETNEGFFSRVQRHTDGLARCHDSGLEAAAVGVEDPATGKVCKFAKLIEDPANQLEAVLYIDDGAGTAEHTTSVVLENSRIPSGGVAVGGELDIYTQHKPIREEDTVELYDNGVLVSSSDYYLNHATGHFKLKTSVYPNGLTTGHTVHISHTYYDQLIGEVQKVIDGDPDDRTNYPGHRAGGVIIKVKAPQVVSQSIVANVTLMTGYSQTALIPRIKLVIAEYINGLSIGGDVIYNEIVERIMAVPGVYDVNVTSPPENYPIADYQVARASSAAIQVS
jgi:uncharacterized phage protein gp47/JayE